MRIRFDRSHPDEAALIAWLDEPAVADPEVRRHVEDCDGCADRVESLRALLHALGDEPTMPAAAILDARRERIAEALGPAPEIPARPLLARRHVLGAAALAAAALASLLLWSPAGEKAAPSTAQNVLAGEAERAAEAVAAAAAPATAEGEADGIVLDDEAVESLTEIQATTPSLADESTHEPTLLFDEFASLSEEDQAAILDELSLLTFEP